MRSRGRTSGRSGERRVGGLYWVAAGMLVAIFGGVVNGWVLLVEILR